jgi:hypothetical protein
MVGILLFTLLCLLSYFLKVENKHYRSKNFPSFPKISIDNYNYSTNFKEILLLAIMEAKKPKTKMVITTVITLL